MPDLSQVLYEANLLLAESGLPLCSSLEPFSDQDTNNPTIIGYAGDRRYAIKACYKSPDIPDRQLRIANLIADRTGLPIPRHLCYATDPTRLPLLIMEWMPGEQLRLVLPSLERQEAMELAADWGRCVARFHNMSIEPSERADFGWSDPKDVYAGFLAWLRGAMEGWFEALKANPQWSNVDINAVRDYLERRAGLLDKPARFGLIKSAQDVRDALALVEPRPHISALLDWEGVKVSDSLWEVTSIFVRLNFLSLDHLWPAFRSGYEAEAETVLSQTPQAEFYVMSRALPPARNGNEGAGRIIKTMLAGARIPFGK